MKRYLYLTILLNFSFISFGQNLPNDCQNYIQACDNQSVSFNVSGAGIQEINPPSCSSQENNSLWVRVTINQSGKLGFTIIPQSTNINEDYDFWVFGPNSNCGSLGSPIRCSTTNPAAAGQSNNHTGLNASSLDLSEGPGPDGDSFLKELDVLSGESYFVVIDRPVGSSPFTLNWSGTATILNPFQNVTFPNFPNITLCDEGADNLEPFDFSTLDASYLSGSTVFFITYFASLQDASLNNNPIVGVTNISQGTYYGRISSLSAQCTEIKAISVIFDNLATNDFNVTECENTNANTIIYDLSSHNSQIYTGTQIVAFKYYNTLLDATNMSNEILNWQNISLPVGINDFYIRISKGSCYDISKLSIEVVQRPNVNSLVTLKQCDDDTDGFSAFNLTEANELIVSNVTNLTFSYFLTLVDAQNNTNPITNDIAFVNQTINTQSVYYRVSNITGCNRTGQLNLVVSATQIPSTFSTIIIQKCDDTFGTNNDGIAVFNLINAQAIISNLFTGQVVYVTFYENEDDALAEINSITNLNTYVNITPNSQDIYVRVDSDLNNECVGFGKYVQLQVENNPIVPPLVIRECDDNADGFFDFDTTNIESQILNGLANVRITYTDENNFVYNVLPNPFTSSSQTLTVDLVNNTTEQCPFTTTLEFIVDSIPIVNTIDQNLLIKCDDEVDPLLQDGIVNFDTSTFENMIIGNQTNVIVEYFDANNVPLTNFIGNFETGTQDISVKVMNANNSNCYASAILSFVVNSLPNIYIDDEDKFTCSDDLTDIEVLTAGLVDETTISNYTYQWYLNNQVLAGANQYELSVNAPGDYSVDVINNNMCFSTRNIHVNSSNIAIIQNIGIEDLVDSNTITILVSGDGDYQYSIDGENYQDSNVFYNVLPGLKTIYIYDLKGCGIASETISVLGVPLFFTPNGDGINDYWNVKGFDEKFGNQTMISIFDRYGKLVKQISSSSEGWDGTFNNVKMPSTDYWYTIDLLDGSVKKGHFSLKR